MARYIELRENFRFCCRLLGSTSSMITDERRCSKTIANTTEISIICIYCHSVTWWGYIWTGKIFYYSLMLMRVLRIRWMFCRYTRRDYTIDRIDVTCPTFLGSIGLYPISIWSCTAGQIRNRKSEISISISYFFSARKNPIERI